VLIFASGVLENVIIEQKVHIHYFIFEMMQKDLIIKEPFEIEMTL
jgi:hypothetical protein